jgi:hypothetical protein
MPDKSSGPSTYVNRQRAAELHDIPAHAHTAAEQHGKSEHLTGKEHSRQAREHSGSTSSEPEAPAEEHKVHSFGHHEIANLAYELWQSRGCPDGSPETDWFQAVHTLRTRASAS